MNRTVSIDYVVLAIVTLLAAVEPAMGATEKILHQFVNIRQGAYPQSGLVADAQGNLYGTSVYGGVFGFGTVFQLAPGANGMWKQTVIYSFTGLNDGAYPNGNVVLDSAGNVYGATTNGGYLGCITGCGVVFELSSGSNGKWTQKVLHRFGQTGDGAFPNGSLVFDSGGSLYGTTSGGGLDNTACREDCGTVFRLTPSGSVWKETLLYEFTAGSDGSTPEVSVVFDSHGNLYGTTVQCSSVAHRV
ncbi:MAG TPA: choice-of-anchor tandem repeat GloVer-containing protein [Terriglobales bacterium]|nr:choice-of-anchor tandem repeat GloVer-containing protein [Terriglobales bacterium]